MVKQERQQRQDRYGEDNEHGHYSIVAQGVRRRHCGGEETGMGEGMEEGILLRSRRALRAMRSRAGPCACLMSFSWCKIRLTGDPRRYKSKSTGRWIARYCMERRHCKRVGDFFYFCLFAEPQKATSSSSVPHPIRCYLNSIYFCFTLLLM